MTRMADLARKSRLIVVIYLSFVAFSRGFNLLGEKHIGSRTFHARPIVQEIAKRSRFTVNELHGLVSRNKWIRSSLNSLIPGEEIVLNRRFLFSPKLTEASLSETILRDLEFLEFRNRGLMRIRGVMVVAAAAGVVYGTIQILRMLRRYFDAQQKQLQWEEIRLFGEYEDPHLHK